MIEVKLDLEELYADDYRFVAEDYDGEWYAYKYNFSKQTNDISWEDIGPCYLIVEGAIIGSKDWNKRYYSIQKLGDVYVLNKIML